MFQRWQLLLGAILLGAILVGSVTRADLSEEEKKALFLKSREKMRTVATPTPEESATPRRKPKPAERPPAKKKKSSKPKPTPEPEETARPARTPRPTPEETPEETPERRAKRKRPTPTPAAAAATAAPTPAASAASEKSSEPAEVIVQKSGYQKPRGFSILPFNLFGKRYKYLTNDVRKQIDRAQVVKERWRFIIVHNSGTRQGNARIFDYYHKNVRRMKNGLAYHFVIGNGTSSGNGEIEIGDRWRRQINGGHVHSDYLNNISLGICLVGDFNRSQPTRAQLEASEELIRYLRARCGKVERHDIPVRPHREMNPPRWATDCPGDDFPYRWFGQFR